MATDRSFGNMVNSRPVAKKPLKEGPKPTKKGGKSPWLGLKKKEL